MTPAQAHLVQQLNHRENVELTILAIALLVTVALIIFLLNLSGRRS